MTTKLYYQDAYQFSFSSVVLSCTPKGENWIVILRETAFFPEGGGQPADAGTLDGAAVLDVHEHNAAVLRITNFAESLYKLFNCCIKIIRAFKLKTGT